MFRFENLILIISDKLSKQIGFKTAKTIGAEEESQRRPILNRLINISGDFFSGCSLVLSNVKKKLQIQMLTVTVDTFFEALILNI